VRAAYDLSDEADEGRYTLRQFVCNAPYQNGVTDKARLIGICGRLEGLPAIGAVSDDNHHAKARFVYLVGILYALVDLLAVDRRGYLLCRRR
jgi:hypothetical protein